MAGPAVAVRPSARELDPAELDELQLDPEDAALSEGIREFTGAEVALMEQEGVEILSMPGAGGAGVDAKDGQVLFQYGQGQSQFTAKMVDHTGSAERVFLYTREGYARMVRRDWVKIYLAKVGPSGRVFFARPPVPTPVPDVPCRKADCRKMLFTVLQEKRHFETKHRQEAVDAEQTRRIEADERQQALAERQLQVLELLVQQNNGNLPENTRAIVEEALKPVAALPDMSWSAEDVRVWGTQNGWTRRELVGMTKSELIELFVPAEPETEGNPNGS